MARATFTYDVGRIITGKIVSVDAASSLENAIRTMIEKSIGSVVVKRGNEHVGILTERDVLKKGVLQKVDISRISVEHIMSSPLITIDRKKSLFDASNLMQEKNVRRLIVTENGKVAGIITQRDVTRGIMDLFLSFEAALQMM